MTSFLLFNLFFIVFSVHLTLLGRALAILFCPFVCLSVCSFAFNIIINVIYQHLKFYAHSNTFA